MVTLTLMQGVVNTFVIFLARIIGNFVDRAVLRNEDGRGIAYIATVIVAEIVLGLFASMIVMWFSRRREFRADAGGARLAGTRQHDRRAASGWRLSSSAASRTGLPAADAGVWDLRRACHTASSACS